jgi:hypothetical protein
MFKDLSDDKKKLAFGMGYGGFFADLKSIPDAYTFAIDIADKCHEMDKAHVVTAIQVLLNTVAVTLAEHMPNAKLICDKMEGCGFNYFTGAQNQTEWQSGLLDALQDLYELETEVIDEFERRLDDQQKADSR